MATTEETTQAEEPKDEIEKTEEAQPASNTFVNKVEQFFKLRQRGSTWVTEIRAGCVTFVTMAYILSVNSNIIADTGGPCKLPSEYGVGEDDSPFYECQETVRLDLITATAVGAFIGCFAMGFAANLPIGLAPGMGINAYFTYSVVGFHGTGKVKYEVALFAVFLEGWIFLILSVCGLRSQIAGLIPEHLKSAITCGIGMFLALIGLQADEGIALVVSDAVTNLTLGGCGHGEDLVCNGFGQECGCLEEDVLTGATTWIGIIGFIIMMICVINKVKGGIIIGILFVSFVSWFRNSDVTYFPDTDAGNARFDYFKKVVNWHGIEKTGGALFDWTAEDWNIDVLIALITMLYVDILDTTGTLYSMATFCGLMEEKEDEFGGCCDCYKNTCKKYKSCTSCLARKGGADFPRSTEAFCSDAIGTIVGAMLGTTDVTAYIESASGINEGGKTGITAIVVGILFFFSLFFSPIFASIPPWATGPALVLIGAFMMDTITEIDWKNYRQSIPAFMTMIIMPFTYSIAYGIIAGLFLHSIIWITDKLFDALCTKLCPNHQEKRYEKDVDVTERPNDMKQTTSASEVVELQAQAGSV